MIQLIFSALLLVTISFASQEANSSTDQDTKIVKRLDDGQPLVE